MPGFGGPQEEEDTTFAEVAAMADRMGMEGDERAQYIDDHMSRLGYERVQSAQSYARPVDPQEQQQQQGGWWRGGGQSRPAQGGGARAPQGNSAGRRDDGDRF